MKRFTAEGEADPFVVMLRKLEEKAISCALLIGEREGDLSPHEEALSNRLQETIADCQRIQSVAVRQLSIMNEQALGMAEELLTLLKGSEH